MGTGTCAEKTDDTEKAAVYTPRREAWTDPSLTASGGRTAAETLILDFQTPELRRSTSAVGARSVGTVSAAPVGSCRGLSEFLSFTVKEPN